MRQHSRRSMLMGGVALAGFAALPIRAAFAQEVEAEEIYGPVKDEPDPVKAIDMNRVNPRVQRELGD